MPGEREPVLRFSGLRDHTVSGRRRRFDGASEVRLRAVGSIAQLGVHLFEIDLANRHLVARILEIIAEQLEVLFVNLVD